MVPEERYMTMNLATKGASTIRNYIADHHKSLKLGPDAGRPTNLVQDIEGAHPAGPYKYVNRPSFYDPRDIRGTTSNKLIRDTNSTDYTLKLDDIEGWVRFVNRNNMTAKLIFLFYTKSLIQGTATPLYFQDESTSRPAPSSL